VTNPQHADDSRAPIESIESFSAGSLGCCLIKGAGNKSSVVLLERNMHYLILTYMSSASGIDESG
jgi:hypothetical protein|tara:strand:+ start:12004 stop:12198 length:195 start_codon:yes stop_codon:yes gene_type:complete